MSRILGFVTGALLVFGGLYFLLTPAGMAPASVTPERPLPRVEKTVPEPEPAESAETEVSQPESPPPAPPSEPAEVQLADRAAPTGPLSPPDIADEQALVEQALSEMQAPVQETQTGPVPATDPQLDALAPDAQPDESVPPPEDDMQWFAVWDPFHSELSANAFARRLERMTGLDYRVVRSGPAKYEVAVAFGSEAERVAHIALIEEATGLRIAGGDR